MHNRMTQLLNSPMVVRPVGMAVVGRRRGSALILVMTILGILFVTGVALMATMSFEARLAAIQQASDGDNAGVVMIGDILEPILQEGTIPWSGAAGSRGSLWGDLPAAGGLVSPIEPYYEGPDMVYGYSTDLEFVRTVAPGSGHSQRQVRTDTVHGTYDPGSDLMYLDADGDGISDSVAVAVDLPTVGISPSEYARLAEALNPPSNPSSFLDLGLRVIPNGGMANLNDSHPNLIEGLMRRNAIFLIAADRRMPYSPLVEEAALRNRGFLPKPRLPVTAIQGDPSNTRDPDVPGGGDFGLHVFPQASLAFRQGESVFRNGHRYWPYFVDQINDPVDYFEWRERMDPDRAQPSPPALDPYDLRHLLTTISHDHQLTRGASVEVTDPGRGELLYREVLDLMLEANYDETTGTCRSPLPFEYPLYPHAATSDCCAPDDRACLSDARKGRMRLSLPWLDEAVANNWITTDQRITLIQDAFTLLLLNARGTEWGTPGTPPAPLWTPNYERIERAAAALTANLIDFADGDDLPTRVERRSANFERPGGVGPMSAGLATAAVVPGAMYGLERQPFITEVAALVNDGNDDNMADADSIYAIELLNPYPDALSVEAAPSGAAPRSEGYELWIDDNATVIPLGTGTASIAGGSFLVLTNDPNNFGVPNAIQEPTLAFPRTDLIPSRTIFLVHKVEYPAPVGVVDIIVDYFEVDGGNTAKVIRGQAGELLSMERANVSSSPTPPRSPWYAPIPTDGYAAVHTLGDDNNATDPDLRPVEIRLGKEGPPPHGTDIFTEAFPTTGSLLLLMRLANRAYGDGAADELAFTTQLETASTQIDNGRMPIFGTQLLHQYDPADTTLSDVDEPGELSQLPWGQLVFDYFTALPLHSEGPYADTTLPIPPAAKPRVDLGGLRAHGRIDINAAPWKVLAELPMIPMEKIPESWRGQLRNALGLVNLVTVAVTGDDPRDPNLPVTAQKVPDTDAAMLGAEKAKAIVGYRELREVVPPPIGSPLGTLGKAGDYSNQRGWRLTGTSLPPGPTVRRGAGFVTLGELANVRHSSAFVEPTTDQPVAGFSSYSRYRMDGGMVGNATEPEDYLTAVAVLVALNDWVTVRSDVFTVYGLLRGRPLDPTIVDSVRDAELDNRAIRFQETIDRLPTLLGQPEPVRIGERVMGRYKDVGNN